MTRPEQPPKALPKLSPESELCPESDDRATLRGQSPRSLYVHVPFCRHRCGYCNFSVVADRDDLIERFLSAVESELRSISERLGQLPELDTLFIGGGTPTHLPPEALARFLGLLRSMTRLRRDFEWSSEANPEDMTDDKLSLMAEHGVNRISLGVQSFNDAKLNQLERGHLGVDARRVVEQTVKRIGNVSIDLIFAAPGETVASWKQDLLTAVSLPLSHVSTYTLTFEKGTTFWNRMHHGDLSPASESNEIQMYDLGRELLGAAGLKHYEISNFAREGSRCRHNLSYWRGDPWFAVGPGAAAYLDGHRTMNHRSTTTYLKRIESGQSAIAETDAISPEEAAREMAAFGVRMIEGIDLLAVQDQTGVDAHCLFADALSRLSAQQLIETDGNVIRLTHDGVHYADTVAAEFLG